MRKRSKYKPKGVRLDVMSWLKSGMLKASEVGGGSIITQTRIKNHLSIDVLRRGEAVKDDVDAIVNAFNVTEALARLRIGDEYSEQIGAAQDALYAMCLRSVDRGKFILTGPELQAINLAMEIHDAQLDVCTVAELEAALDYVWEQIRLRKVRRLPTPPASVT